MLLWYWNVWMQSHYASLRNVKWHFFFILAKNTFCVKQYSFKRKQQSIETFYSSKHFDWCAYNRFSFDFEANTKAFSVNSNCWITMKVNFVHPIGVYAVHKMVNTTDRVIVVYHRVSVCCVFGDCSVGGVINTPKYIPYTSAFCEQTNNHNNANSFQFIPVCSQNENE